MDDLVIYNSRSFCYILGCLFGNPHMLDKENKRLVITNLRNYIRLQDSLYENGIDFSDGSELGTSKIYIHDVALYNYIFSIRHDDWKDFPPIIEMYDLSHKLDFVEGLDDAPHMTKRIEQLRQKLCFAFPEIVKYL